MNSRRWLRVAACVVFLAVLSACVDVGVRLAFMPDGSGNIALQFTVPSWIMSKNDLRRSVAHQKLPAGFKVVINDTSKPDTVKVNIQGPFKSLKELHGALAKLLNKNAAGLKGHFEARPGGFFHRTYELELAVRPSYYCDPSALSSFQITIRMPGTIIKSNTSKRGKDTVVWRTSNGWASKNLRVVSRTFSLLEPFTYVGARARALARWLQGKSISERLVFGSKDTILVVKPMGGEPHPVWRVPVRSFSVARNGLVALQPKTDDPFHSDLVVVSVGHPGKPVIVLKKAGYDPRISPDGKLLAYVRPTAEFSKRELAHIAANYRRAESFRINPYVARRNPEATRATAEKVAREFRGEETGGAADEAKASHILIKVMPDASIAERAEAEAKAEAVAKMARSGEDFQALAKKYSEDPGSKNSGGELGWFGRGRMVSAFENAVFSHKPGEIVGPIQTAFGYHIIRVEGFRVARRAPRSEDYLERANLESECGGETTRRIFLGVDGQIVGPLPCRGGWIVARILSHAPPWGDAIPDPKRTEIVVRNIQTGEEKTIGGHPKASNWMHRLEGWGLSGEGLSYSSVCCFPSRFFGGGTFYSLYKRSDGYVYSGAEWSGAILADGSIIASGEGHLWVHRPQDRDKRGLVGRNRQLDRELLSRNQDLESWAVAPNRRQVAFALDEALRQEPPKTRYAVQVWDLMSGAFQTLDTTVVASGPDGGFLNLAWTPDGQQLVYEKGGSPHSLWAVAPKSPTARRLADGSFPILFVKQGSSIIYRCGDKVCSIPVSGGKPTVLELPLQAMSGTVVQVPRLGAHTADVIAYGLVTLASLIILTIFWSLLFLVAIRMRKAVRRTSRQTQGPTCPRCHAVNQPGARFCKQCGAPVGVPPDIPEG